MTAASVSHVEPQGDETAQLLRRCADGDSRAWDRLLAEVRRPAFDLGRWKYRLGTEDAEELAQVVQLRVSQRLPQLRDPSAFPFLDSPPDPPRCDRLDETAPHDAVAR